MLLLLAVAVWTLVWVVRRQACLFSLDSDNNQREWRHSEASPLELEPQAVRHYCERWDRLTLRKRQIARLAAEGKQNSEIADELQVSVESIGTHLRDIYKTLGIRAGN